MFIFSECCKQAIQLSFAGDSYEVDDRFGS